MPIPNCKCALKFDGEQPIVLIDAKDGTGRFKGVFDPDPKCEPADECLKRVTYKWTLEKTDGSPALSGDDKPECTVKGPGEFKLCLKVVLKCYAKINEPKPGDTTMVFRLGSTCQDEACKEFLIL